MDFSKVTEYLKTLQSHYGVRGSDIKVTKDQQEIYRHQEGFRDYQETVPVSDRDLYNIYSASKVITMIGVMQLVEQGRLGLYDELSCYLPEFDSLQYAEHFDFLQQPAVWPDSASVLKPAHNKIYIYNLMSMTAGLSYDLTAEPIRRMVESTKGKATTRQIVSAMAQMPLLCEPGTRYYYSLAHDVLAAVVEVVTGMTFGAYMRQYVFDPLAVKEMFYQVPTGMETRLAAQYRKDPVTGEIRPDQSMAYRFTPFYESGGAGLCTTVDEYSKILTALANGGVGANGHRILRPESIDCMRKNWLDKQELMDFSTGGKKGYGYGLGVRTLLDAAQSKSPVGEFGWDGAAGAYVLVDPLHHLTIFYAQEILDMPEVYSEVHPTLRDLVYEAIEK